MFNITYIHTHTRLTALCPRLPGWANTRKVKLIWILLKQEAMCLTLLIRNRFQACMKKFDIGPANSFPSPPLRSRPPLIQLGSLGERCKLHQRGLGQSPNGNWIWCILALKSDIWWHQIYYLRINWQQCINFFVLCFCSFHFHESDIMRTFHCLKCIIVLDFTGI